MELNGKTLEEVLNTELVGKDVGYSHWNFTGALLKVLRILAKEAGLNENDFSYKAQGTNSVYLTYKNISFGDATFQKQKGRYKYGRYEWTFKKVFVNLWNESGYSSYKGLTFQEMLNKIDDEVAAKENAAMKQRDQAIEIFNMIRDKLGTDTYGTRNFIEYLSRNRYSFE